MEPLILIPRRDLWAPRRLGLSPIETIRLRIAAFDDTERRRLPHYLTGDRASGDTLAVFGPAANQPPATNYAAVTLRNGHLVLGFDTTTQQTAIFAGVMPRNYAGGGLTVSLAWMAASATSGTIGWGITFERMNPANHDLDADAFATEQIVTATTVDATSGKVTVTSVAITAGSTGTDSIAPGDAFRLRVRRDVATDTATGDAHLISVEVKET
jgi:hypothetical protein